MRLVEKKCPGCGAQLEFGENDRSCKCSYCKKSFEIERDSTLDAENQYILKPKTFSILFWGIFSFAAIFIIIIVIFMFSNFLNFDSYGFDKSNYYSNITDVSNHDIEMFDGMASMKINTFDSSHKYSYYDRPTREKVYLASNNNGNYLIIIYKVVYINSVNTNERYVVYVPVIFTNVSNDVDTMGGERVLAPEYYFNSEKTSYTYGYSSFDEAYNGVVKPLENDYQITERN